MNNEPISSNLPGSGSRPGVDFLTGQGGLPKLRVDTGFSVAEIYLQGAHVTHFQLAGGKPVLFLSEASRFQAGHPIRGGIPIILPWFGPREGFPAHGVVRSQSWTVSAVEWLPAGDIRVAFQLDCPTVPGYAPLAATFHVTVGASLDLELTVRNLSKDANLLLEDCLHTYFTVGDIDSLSIHGLQGVTYLDKVAGGARCVESADAITVKGEVDRVYLDSAGTVEIHDPAERRRIIVAKQGSASTVVWNPWIAKSRRMEDFGDEEYRRMVCVESGNVGPNRRLLTPGEAATLSVRISTGDLP